MAIISPLWRNRFPRTIEFLETQLVGVEQGNPRVWNSFIEVADLSADAARVALASNDSFPGIWFRDLGGFDGYFRHTVTNRIEINTLVATQFEQQADNAVAQTFLTAKVLHEMVHWALFPNEPQNSEMGVKFEEKAFDLYLPRFWEASPVPPTSSEEIIDHPRTPSLLGQPEFANDDLTKDMPRGIRNNNPGNIKRGNDQWRGLAEEEEMKEFQKREQTFLVFEEAKWGLRAMARILSNYQKKHGLRTIFDMIDRWAPAHDNNDPNTYANAVAQRVGKGIGEQINFEDSTIAIPMMQAMIRVENGLQPYTAEQVREAHQLALVG